jgi:hypothetical protein
MALVSSFMKHDLKGVLKYKGRNSESSPAFWQIVTDTTIEKMTNALETLFPFSHRQLSRGATVPIIHRCWYCYRLDHCRSKNFNSKIFINVVLSNQYRNKPLEFYIFHIWLLKFISKEIDFFFSTIYEECDGIRGCSRPF